MSRLATATTARPQEPQQQHHHHRHHRRHHHHHRQQQEIDIEEAPHLDEQADAHSSGRSTAAESISSAEQVVTSLQVNSKKASPDKKDAPTKLVPPQPATTTTTAEAAAVTLTSDKNRKRPKYVLDPSGSLYYHWSMVVSFAFLYNFWSLSYRFAFREIDYDTMPLWFALDYSADLIYLMDIVINSRTGFLEDGVLQRNVAKVRHHYSESTLFYLDCLCLLPLDFLYLSFGFNSILRCARLVKIYKFWSYVDRTERHTNYPNVFRTFTLVHYILVIFHWNACLFHMISKNKLIDIENLYKINDNRCYDILCQYLHAFYWSTLALTTIGDLPRPRTKGEYVYVTVELFFGLFLFASVLGHVANIVTNVSAARKEFQAKLDGVKTFMRMRRVSDELQNKVIQWFDYLWISQQSSDEDKSVACLPDRLKAEIAIHVHLDTLKRVDIFQNTEAGFLCELVLRLKPVLFSPGDYVCRKNEVGHEMYIISRGRLEVVTDEGKVVVATLKAGSYFGEISVLNVGLAGNKRTASVRSVGYSDLFCLKRQDLWDVLKNYPNAEARIRARAEERLSKLDIKSSGSQRRRSNGSSQIARAPMAKSKSQLDDRQQPTKSGQLHSASCGCFANGKGLSNNGCCLPARRASKPECVCRGCLAAKQTDSSSGRPRMPLARCHKSGASLNSGQYRRAGMSSSSAHVCRPCRVVSHDDYDHHEQEHDLEPEQACTLANCRRHHNQQLQSRLHPSDEQLQVSYSKSFDNAARMARQHHHHQHQHQRAADSEEFLEGSNSALSMDDNDTNLMTIRSGQLSTARGQKSGRRCRLTRRSSSAEPPIDADSWRQLRRMAQAGPMGAERRRRDYLADRRATDEDYGGDCAKHTASARRRGQEHKRPTASVEGQHPAPGGYWVIHQQPEMPATYIRVPMEQVGPDSQQQSWSLFGGANQSTRTQSMSTMCLNLQAPTLLSQHQPGLHPGAAQRQSPLYFEPSQAEQQGGFVGQPSGQTATAAAQGPTKAATSAAAAAAAKDDRDCDRATREQEEGAHESKVHSDDVAA